MRYAAWLSIILLLTPVLGWARGQRTYTVTRTAYFPGGPGSIVTVKSKQGKGAYTGARTRVVKVTKKRLTKKEMEVLKKKSGFKGKRFAVHKTWTIVTVGKKKPF